jgi:hypothetical protein
VITQGPSRVSERSQQLVTTQEPVSGEATASVTSCWWISPDGTRAYLDETTSEPGDLPAILTLEAGVPTITAIQGAQ